eukprot:4103177-Prymnesium_polylepis.3
MLVGCERASNERASDMLINERQARGRVCGQRDELGENSLAAAVAGRAPRLREVVEDGRSLGAGREEASNERMVSLHVASTASCGENGSARVERAHCPWVMLVLEDVPWSKRSLELLEYRWTAVYAQLCIY